MRAIWDHSSLQLPYVAVAPWPLIELNGQCDWIATVSSVESWLNSYIGAHWAEWAWATYSLDSNNFCAVSFRREKYCTLFLLVYS
jgi:hypothetical protein